MHRLLGGLLLAVCAAACGLGEGPDEETSGPLQQGDLDHFRERGTLRSNPVHAGSESRRRAP